MSGTFLYQWVLAGPCVGECLSVLDDASLCTLSGWLGREYDENGKTGEVLGMCYVETHGRFVKRVAEKATANLANEEGHEGGNNLSW